jgi:tetratricopeptide (TPR) repeat protein
VERTVVTPARAASVGELLAEAHLFWQQGDSGAAAAAFDSLVRYDPDGEQAARALHWAALAHEQEGAHETAVLRFETLIRRFPTHPLALDAQLRAVRLWGYLDDWARAAIHARRLLPEARRLGLVPQVALHGAVALQLLGDGELGRAAYHIAKGRQIAERAGLDRLDWLPRDVAQLYFALGEWRRRAGAKVVFVPFPEDFAGQFERRAQLLLDAQSAYLDAMRARDARWSARAGFRVGELYQQLHTDVLAMPPPLGVPPERRELFVAATRYRYLVLLEKGLGMVERTLAMAERTEERSDWVERLNRQRVSIAETLDEQRDAIDRAPYSRLDLTQILGEIGRRQPNPETPGTAPGRH